MSLVCSVIFIHHAFNANILDKDYAFSDGEILMVDNAVRTHFEPYERHFKEIGFTENTIKKYLQCTNIQTVTVPVPAKFLRASNVPTGLLNEMIAYLNSEERNHHNFSELLLFSCLYYPTLQAVTIHQSHHMMAAQEFDIVVSNYLDNIEN